MGIEKVKLLLSELQKEIKNSSAEVDETTKQQLQEMDANIHKMLNQSNQQDDIYGELVKMEYEFLNNHPVASNIMREIVSILSRAGI
jgi:septal ring factor EnvC (AmiA/AmiB activator)